MSTIAIQTDLLSIILLGLGAFAAGGLAVWFMVRRRSANEESPPPSGSVSGQQLLLIFSRLSHHLKTAGEVIRGHLHGFDDNLPQDVERWRVARRAISEESSELSGLIERLDLLVRLGMVGQPLVMEPVNIPRLLEDLMIDLGPAADAKGILLGGVVKANTQAIPHLSADVLALREVFSNLLENAVKHNDSGTEVVAEVSCRNNHMCVRVADTGKGVEPELLSEIFEKGPGSYRPRGSKGTGMGLYLARLFVELHGGTISARNVEPHGTEFRVTLPLRRSA